MIKSNVQKLGVLGIDLNLLLHHGKALSGTTTSLSRIYGDYYRSVIRDTPQRSLCPENAYAIWFEEKTYDGSLQRKIYDVLLRQRELSYYLSAVYYREKLKEYSSTDMQIPESSVLNHFFNREQNLYLVESLEQGRIAKKLSNHS